MINPLLLLASVIAYVGLLLAIAVWGERGSKRARGLASSGAVYALSLTVYCTSWTYYGSVGKAATSGTLFLAIYLGPTLGALFWWVLLRRLIRIKRQYRVTSVADFLSLRYGRSGLVAALVAVIAFVGSVPYLALQLKAVLTTSELMTGGRSGGFGAPWAVDHMGLLVVVLMIAFTILFGVRRLDPTERHPGMVLSLATECVFKLLAFLAVGLFVTYGLFDGFGDIAARAEEAIRGGRGSAPIHEPQAVTFFSYALLSMCAFLFLPRQFHVAVVECSEERGVRTAQWATPLYLLLINLFVIPIALGGLLLGLPVEQADSYVLAIPLGAEAHWLSLAVFLGGFSAAAGMIMVSSMTLSTMTVNHLILPVLERAPALAGVRRYLLQLRWLVVAVIVSAGYGFATTIGESYMLVNMGMISFAAAAQLVPAILLGLLWRDANRSGAVVGLCVGFTLWAYTLLLPALARSGWLPMELVDEGLLGISWLRPEQLFGIEGLDKITHALATTMAGNISGLVLGSLVWKTSERERQLTDELFGSWPGAEALGESRQAEGDIPFSERRERARALFSRYLPDDEASAAVRRASDIAGLSEAEKVTVSQLAELQRAVEQVLAGILGTAAAHRAVLSAGLLTAEEQERLSTVYADILARLRVPPEELRKRVDVYEERSRWMEQHAEELEAKVKAQREEMARRREAEQELQRHQQQLEERVRERTAELSEVNAALLGEIKERELAQREQQRLHEELMEASRQAGMAEVATSVLHNVGNVLNSINVTAEVAKDRVERSRVSKLRRSVEMLSARKDQLTDFVKTDRKGKLLLPYLEQLSERLAEEQRALKGDLAALTGHLEHVKRIVQMQQSYASAGSINEDVSLRALVDDAIALNAGTLSRMGVELQLDVDDAATVRTDKHKVLQIMINLVSNAKHAIKAAPKSREHRLAVRGRLEGDEAAVLEVEDTGVGISEEDLARVFQYGFTTKPDGHGFGLHSAANAAVELGGELTARSDGPGQGACFTLRFPASVVVYNKAS